MKNSIISVTIIVIVIVVGWFAFGRGGTQEANALDGFAQCLAEKQITMYGADWCPHCQNEKKAFGKSFRLVPYVECPAEPEKCLSVGIEGYPTWIFPDGRRFTGEQGVEKLSRESGCNLPSGR